MTRWHSVPAELYAVVEHTPATVLLESAPPSPADSSSGRASQTRLFTAPLRVLVTNNPEELPNLFAEIERAVSTGLYAAGYFSYECGAFFEPKAAPVISSSQSPQQPLAQPLAWFGIYLSPYVFDHATGAFLADNLPPLAKHPAPQGPDPVLNCTIHPTEQQYAKRIDQIHAFIRAGDVYQLNFTIPIQVHTAGSSAALYRRLRSLQPAPYGAFLHTQPNHRILSFSPELFFRVEAEHAPEPPVPHPCDVLPSQGWESNEPIRRITTRPMKGTVSRGRTTTQDRIQSHWLANDPKNRAENVMIVDLLRNDLGRLCTFGSVHATDLFAVERYPTLWQMTSTITGDLRPEAGFQDIFRALFPCGSITGAPKIRAMQLISKLERQPRGVYTGAIGFFSKAETIFNVAIRTLVLDGESGVMGVGSGIVIDSKPADEWRECLLKARFLTRVATTPPHPAPDSFSLVETLRWEGNYPLIELHLDRLEDSVAYFAFPFNRAQTKAALESHAAGLIKNLGSSTELGAPSIPRFSAEWVGDHDSQPAPAPANSLTSYPRAAGADSLPQTQTPHKVRLLLNPDGTLQITSEPILEPSTQPLRIRIAAERTDPQDPMYFHKTTHRPLYAQAHQAATQAGYDEVLFLNQRGEVSEAAIHNIFIEKNGHLLTPPLDCGLLPGVHRRHILESNPNAHEAVLTIEDLRQADTIYLCNAVRGLRKAIVDWQTN
jgi:para-aminobenzoate synthetase/4-amino-4-deoxychorismate lyase